jgi:ABC-type thiamine transport system substrate-binding protein
VTGLIFVTREDTKMIKDLTWKFRALAAIALLVCFVGSQTLWAADHVDMDATRKEAKVTIYASISRKDVTVVAKAFEKEYPWIKPEVYRAGKVKLAQRIVTEARAGKPRFDVLLSSAFATLEIKLQNLLARYESPHRKYYRKELKDPQGYWTAGQINVMSLGYNTDLVKKGEVPRSWQDLLDPKWKGKIAINANRPEWYVGLLQIMGKEEGRKYMESLAALETVPGRSATLTRQFLAAGEYPLYANAAAGNMEQFKIKDAPVDWARMDVLPTYPILVSVSSPENPCANGDRPGPGLFDQRPEYILHRYRSPGREGRRDRRGIQTDLLIAVSLPVSVRSRIGRTDWSLS